jgi:hypothetical protein
MIKEPTNTLGAGACRRHAIRQTIIVNLRRVARDAGLTPRTLGTGAPACATHAGHGTLLAVAVKQPAAQSPRRMVDIG